MSEHLPECGAYREGGGEWPDMRCICDRLRAAEQRQGALSYAHGLDHGYAAGIKAARDAVADLPNHYAMEPRHVALALAAIDALTK